MKKIAAAIIYILAFTPSLVNGQQIDFGKAWKEQRFSIFNNNHSLSALLMCDLPLPG